MSDLPNRHVPVSFAIKILHRSITREYFWSDNVILWQNPKRTPDLSPSPLPNYWKTISLFFFPQPNPVPPSSASLPTPPARRWVGRWVLRSQPSLLEGETGERCPRRVNGPDRPLIRLKTPFQTPFRSERVPPKATRALGPMNLENRLLLLELPPAGRALLN